MHTHTKKNNMNLILHTYIFHNDSYPALGSISDQIKHLSLFFFCRRSFPSTHTHTHTVYNIFELARSFLVRYSDFPYT